MYFISIIFYTKLRRKLDFKFSYCPAKVSFWCRTRINLISVMFLPLLQFKVQILFFLVFKHTGIKDTYILRSTLNKIILITVKLLWFKPNQQYRPSQTCSQPVQCLECLVSHPSCRTSTQACKEASILTWYPKWEATPVRLQPNIQPRYLYRCQLHHQEQITLLWHINYHLVRYLLWLLHFFLGQFIFQSEWNTPHLLHH